MKKAAIDTTIENEKKLKRLQHQQQGSSISSRRTSMSRDFSSKLSNHSSPTNEDSSDSDSAIDLHNEDQYQHVETMFEKIYNDGLNGKIPAYDYNLATLEAASPVVMAENELSPYLRPHPVTAAPTSNAKGAVQAPMKPSTSPLVSRRRDSMSSPEQFLMQFLQTPKDVRPPNSPLMKPSEFTKYQQDRESSTTSSSARSRNYPTIPRRSSVQSDGSWSSVYSPGSGFSQQMIRASSGSKISTSVAPNEPINTTTQPAILNRRRAFSFQQPASIPNAGASQPNTTVRRRSLLRELTNLPPDTHTNDETAPQTPRSPLYQQQHYYGSSADDYSTNHNATALIPAFNNHHNNSSVLLNQQQQQQQHNVRSQSVLAFHAISVAAPRPASKVSSYPVVRKDSPNNSNELRRSAAANNVFDRLSSGHTHASQAKKRLGNYRYSSSSIDDLRKQWANELSERYSDE
jgi:hypothetical protein